MTQKDHAKVMRAGFQIIRADEQNLKIKHKRGDFEWATLEKEFASKVALRRRMNELLEQKLIIED